jgi:hypothetical protein
VLPEETFSPQPPKISAKGFIGLSALDHGLFGVEATLLFPGVPFLFGSRRFLALLKVFHTS